jgi:hypothetical protein
MEYHSKVYGVIFTHSLKLRKIYKEKDFRGIVKKELIWIQQDQRS